jgi:hypothetical protein
VFCKLNPGVIPCIHSYSFSAQIHRLSQAESLILELDFSTNLIQGYQDIFGSGAHLESEHGPNFKCASEFSTLLEKVATSFLTKIHRFAEIRQKAFFRAIKPKVGTGTYDPFKRHSRGAGAGRVALIVSLGALGLSAGELLYSSRNYGDLLQYLEDLNRQVLMDESTSHAIKTNVLILKNNTKTIGLRANILNMNLNKMTTVNACVLKQTSYIEISTLQSRLSGLTDDLINSRLSTRIIDILDVASFIDKDILFENSLYKSYLPLLYRFSKISVIETDLIKKRIRLLWAFPNIQKRSFYSMVNVLNSEVFYNAENANFSKSLNMQIDKFAIRTLPEFNISAFNTSMWEGALDAGDCLSRNKFIFYRPLAPLHIRYVECLKDLVAGKGDDCSFLTRRVQSSPKFSISRADANGVLLWYSAGSKVVAFRDNRAHPVIHQTSVKPGCVLVGSSYESVQVNGMNVFQKKAIGARSLIFVDQKHPNIFVKRILDTLRQMPTAMPDLVLNGTLTPREFKLQTRSLPFHRKIGLWTGLLSSIYPIVAIIVAIYCFCRFKDRCRGTPETRAVRFQ